MRIKYLKIIMAVLVLSFASNSDLTYADEPEKQPAPILLSDGSIEYQVLKKLFDSGFFSANKIMAQYLAVDDAGNNKIKESGKAFLISDLKKDQGEKFASFRLYSSDSIRQNFMISWETPSVDSYRRNVSIRSMIALANEARESTLPEAIVDNAGVSKSIKDMSVRYNDPDKSEVAGYELTMHTGFSPTHRFVRTLSELTLVASLGVANYYINKDENMEDWRYKYRWEDVWPRFRDGWSWDGNAFRTNTVYHIYAGIIYYQTARSNEYGILASTAWAFAGSLIWEYFGEWREKVSVNDMIFTPMGGVLVGEALSRSAIYIENNMPNSVYGGIISFILDPMRIINRRLDHYLDGDYKVSIVFLNPAVQAVIDKQR